MSKEKLLGLSFRKESIEIEGEKYIVRELNADEAQRYESSLYKIVGKGVEYNAKEAKTKLVMMALYEKIDGKEQRVFEDKDHELVKRLPSHVVDQVFQVASRLNGLDVAEAEKN